MTKTLTVRQRRSIGFGVIARTAVKVYLKRSILCVALFVGQAFLYNGITFNLGTLMSTFFGVTSGFVPVFLIMYAASNFLGPLTLGRLFDTVGRVPMISITYLGSAALGLLLAGLFAQAGLLGRWSFIAVVMATFFLASSGASAAYLASSGASAAYLTASEIFPMETRALAIAFFYAIGTAVGGIIGPLLFGPLIATGSHRLVALAFLIGAALMITGGVAELLFGVRAEGTQLEDIAKPLTVEEAERGRAAAGQGAAPRGTAPAAGVREPQEAAPPAGHDGDRGPGGRRAAASEMRARNHEEEAEALVATDTREADRHRALAKAALEHARAAEQQALAAEARAVAGGATRIWPSAKAGEGREPATAGDGRARVRMHDLWAQMHAELARAHECRAAGQAEAAAQAERAARACAERARAASYRIEAAEREAEA